MTQAVSLSIEKGLHLILADQQGDDDARVFNGEKQGSWSKSMSKMGSLGRRVSGRRDKEKDR